MKAYGDDWVARLGAGVVRQQQVAPGWAVGGPGIPGFIRPSLQLKIGNPDTARIIILAAPGAVGKSAYARELCQSQGRVLVDLAQTEPLGGNFFVGGLFKAFGASAVSAIQEGHFSLVVDSLDEAQLRTTSDAFIAGLTDLAKLVSESNAAPAVLLARTIAAEEAFLQLDAAGFDVAMLEIAFFDDAQAENYMEAKLPVVASRNSKIYSAFEAHGPAFLSLARNVRLSIAKASGSDSARFSGYAPVLDAVCEFVLDEEQLNPVGRAADASGMDDIALLRVISRTILEREQKKLTEQLRRKLGIDVSEEMLHRLYTPDDQLAYLSSLLFDTPRPQISALSTNVEQAYRDMVDSFLPQHPFTTDTGAPANVVFAAFVAAWALQQPTFGASVRQVMARSQTFLTGLFFEMYLVDEPGTALGSTRSVPLDDIGLLYSSLSARLLSGQKAYLEMIQSDDDGPISVSFAIVDPSSADNYTRWDEIEADGGGVVQIRSTAQMLSIDAPIALSIGDGTSAHITDSSEISVRSLHVHAEKLRVGQPFEGNAGDVVLVAEGASVGTVTAIEVAKGYSLFVSWIGADVYPWHSYAFDRAESDDDTLLFMRRRLRKILTAFRSHSKGSMRRFAGKMEHSRMVKDDRGRRLLDALLRDGVLSLVDDRRFYELRPARLSEVVGLDYNALQQQRYTSKSDDYVRSVV